VQKLKLSVCNERIPDSHFYISNTQGILHNCSAYFFSLVFFMFVIEPYWKNILFINLLLASVGISVF